MVRALFISEIKRTFAQNALIAAVVLMMVGAGKRIAISRGFPAEEATLIGNGFLVFLVFLSAFVFGAKAFGQLKESHSAFLLTLPASRSGVWWTIALANLLGAIALAAGIGIYHVSSVLAVLPRLRASDSVALLVLYVWLFFLGCWSVLIFKRAASVGVAAVFLGGASLSIFIAVLTYLQIDFPTLTIIGFLMSFYFLFLFCFGSLKAFVRGEFHDVRVRITNLGALVVLMIGFTLLCVIAIDFQIPASWSDWNGPFRAGAVSNDGSHLAVVYSNSTYTVYARTDVIDLATGKTTGRFTANDLVTPVWSNDGRILNLVSRPLLLPNTLIRLALDGGVIQKTRAPFFTSNARIAKSGGDLMVVGVRGKSRVAFKTGDSAGDLHTEWTMRLNDPLPKNVVFSGPLFWRGSDGRMIIGPDDRRVFLWQDGTRRQIWP